MGLRRAFIPSFAMSLVFGCTSAAPRARMETAPAAMAFADHAGVRVPRFDLSEVHPTHLIRPAFPQEGKQSGGVAIVRVFVRPDGSIDELEVRKSEPSAVMGSAASQAVAQWRFPILVRNGTSLAYCVDATVVFAAEGAPPL